MDSATVAEFATVARIDVPDDSALLLMELFRKLGMVVAESGDGNVMKQNLTSGQDNEKQ